MFTSCFSSSTQLNAGELKADAAAVKRKAFLMAAVRHSLERGMQRSGISTIRSRNCMVLLQRIVMRTPQGKILKSALVNCLRGSNDEVDTGNKWDLRNMPQKAMEAFLALIWYNELKNQKVTVTYVYIIRYSRAKKHLETFPGQFFYQLAQVYAGRETSCSIN